MLSTEHGKKVTKAYLYCTKEDSGDDPLIELKVDAQEVDKTIDEFKSVVNKIEGHDYSGGPKDKNTCNNCSVKWACSKK